MSQPATPSDPESESRDEFEALAREAAASYRELRLCEAEFEDKVMAGLAKQPVSAGIRRWFVAAAAILFCAGLWTMFREKPQSTAPSEKTGISAIGETVFLRRDSTYFSQSLNDFSLRELKPGMKIGEDLVKQFEEDNVLLSTPQGLVRVGISTHNRTALNTLAGEAAWRIADCDRSLDMENLNRLIRMASFGQPDAVRFVEAISKREDAWSDYADDVRQEIQKSKTILSLTRQAMSGSASARDLALRGLLRNPSPLALQALSNILENGEIDTALAAVDVVRRYPDPRVLPVLLRMQLAPERSAVREAVDALTESLLSEESR